ncbi:1,3-beta-glucan synthase component FKS1, partial [Tetrabaena socialis]
PGVETPSQPLASHSLGVVSSAFLPASLPPIAVPPSRQHAAAPMSYAVSPSSMAAASNVRQVVAPSMAAPGRAASPSSREVLYLSPGPRVPNPSPSLSKTSSNGAEEAALALSPRQHQQPLRQHQQPQQPQPQQQYMAALSSPVHSQASDMTYLQDQHIDLQFVREQPQQQQLAQAPPPTAAPYQQQRSGDMFAGQAGVPPTAAAPHHALWLSNLQGASSAAVAQALAPAPTGPPPSHYPPHLQQPQQQPQYAGGSYASYAKPPSGPSSASGIPFIPALPAPVALPSLPEPPAAEARRPFSDRIHNTAWASCGGGGSDDDCEEYGSKLYESPDPYGIRSASSRSSLASLSSGGGPAHHRRSISSGASETAHSPRQAAAGARRGRRAASPSGSHAASADSGDERASSAADLEGEGKKGGKKRGKGRDAASAAELVAMLSGQGDEQLAQWAAFAAVWDAVVEDLRSSDLISDREQSNLVFTRLPAAYTSMASASAPHPASASATASGPAPSISGESGVTGTSADSASSSASGAKPLRPILLPAFFYAGQLQRVVDTGAASPSQLLVLCELRSLLVWFGCQLQLVDGAQAEALLAASCVPATIDVAHTRSRERGLSALRRLVEALAGLQEPLPPAGSGGVGPALRRRQALYGEAGSALEGVLECAEVEARAVVRQAAAGSRRQRAAADKQRQAEGAPDPQCAAVALLEAVAAMRSGVVRQPERLAAVLAALHPESGGRSAVPAPSSPPASASAAAAGSVAAAAPLCVDLPLLRRVTANIAKMLNLSAAAAQPTGAEACRILGFFVTSLANRQLAKPAPVTAMTSWTVITPAFCEDVLFPLDARVAAEAMGLAGPGKGKPGGSGPGAAGGEEALPDLLTETEERVSLMAYLRSMFPKDWDNFKERLGESLGGHDLSKATEADFCEGGPLAEHALALQLWASYRGQLLARTVRGMACYERALRVLAALEAPRGPGVGRLEHAATMEDLVGGKFSHVVASQLYGRNRRSRNLRERWLAESTDVLLEAFPHLRVSFLDVAPAARGGGAGAPPQHYAVLIRGRRAGSAARWEGFVSQGGATAAAAAAAVAGARAAAGRTEELYRVRLPHNRYSGRGVILGEGKPENQNHAIIFCFGEALQTIDMNQDNALAEALKMRNLLQELAPERETRAARRAAGALEAQLAAAAAAAPAGAATTVTIPSARRGAAATAAVAATAVCALPPAVEFKRALGELRGAERPVAVVGFREWVFSDKAGALGSFAASSEFAFSTMVQRTMAYPANVRLHYGHPDAFNKLFVMTRGGVAKATRQLHVSEDIFGGMNHSLRGGRIKFREYISVGKGRDTGFDSINAFESKISAGFGEVALSRDLLRMASRVDLWRCLHLYHSLAGNYFNTWLVMGSVYAHVYALLFFALARATVYRTITYYPSPPPPPPGTPMVPMVAGGPPPPIGVVREDLSYDTIRVEHVLQLGLLSVLPYVAELALEQGLVRAVLAALAQVLSGSFTFFIFKQQTTTTALHRSTLYGGATYVATGRGFSITSSSFIKLFANYGRSHIALGFELAAMAIAVAATNECARCSYAGLTWGTWLAALSLILAPCWFNPMAFSLAKVKRDMHAWAAWLRGEADRELGCTWHQWNRRQLAHARNESGAQTDRWLNVAQNLAMRAVPPALLAFAAASRLTLRLERLPALPSVFRSSWALFIAASALTWCLLAVCVSASRRFGQLSDRRRMRLFSFWTGAAGIAGVVVFLLGLSRWYSGSGITNLCLIVYANIQLLLAVHRTLEQVAPRSRRARRLVDGGHQLLDSLVGWTVLGLLGALSMAGVVQRIQTTMLFNVTFARSVRRGSLVKTIGTVKAERGQQAALAGLVLNDGDVASVGSSRGGGGGKLKGGKPPRMQLQA